MSQPFSSKIRQRVEDRHFCICARQDHLSPLRHTFCVACSFAEEENILGQRCHYSKSCSRTLQEASNSKGFHFILLLARISSPLSSPFVAAAFPLKYVSRTLPLFIQALLLAKLPLRHNDTEDFRVPFLCGMHCTERPSKTKGNK